MSQLVKKIRTSAGDLPVDYNSLANLPTISNPNLLINSDFRNPINQRGSTIYYGGANKYYTVDRWCMGANDFDRTVEIVDGGIKITNPNTTYIGSFQQVFENLLPSGDYTLSIKVTAISGAVTIFCDGANTGSQKNLEVGINTKTMQATSISAVNIHLAASSSVVIEWIKLEVGTTPTPFSPRTYAEELALCRRYFDIMGGTRTIGVEQDYNANTFTYAIPRNVMMRTTPTISIHGTTTTNSTDGICVRTIGCAILPGFTFTYSLRGWELLVVAKSSTPLNKMCYETQLYINDAFKIYLDAEIR